MTLISVNGVDFTPYLVKDGYQWNKFDLDSADSGRALDGTLIRKKVATKHKIDLTFSPLNTSEISIILQAIKSTNLTCIFLDPEQGDYSTKNCYANNIPAQAPIIINDEVRWDGLKISLVEY